MSESIKRIRLRNDRDINWTDADTVLARGEFGIEFDADGGGANARFKIGDGVLTWSNLPYAGGIGVGGGGGSTDHGLLIGLDDDDHAQYALTDGSRGDFASLAQGALADSAVQPEDIGSAAAADSGDFATAAQGILADSAVQPGDLGTAASSDSGDFATAAQGALADSAVQPGDLGDSASRDVGSGANTVCAGDDVRLSDTRDPNAHNHSLSEILQSGAIAGQVPTWNGTNWAAATPVETNPGGVSGQPQFNNGGTFAGMSGWVWDNAIETLVVDGEIHVDKPADGTGTFSVAQLGEGATAKCFRTGILAAAFDFRTEVVGGLFFVNYGDKYLASNINSGYRQWRFKPSAELCFDNGTFLGWADNLYNIHGLSADTRIYRDAAGEVGFRNGSNPQTVRVYTDWTDASNYQGLKITGNKISLDSAGSGVGADNRNLELEPDTNGRVKADRFLFKYLYFDDSSGDSANISYSSSRALFNRFGNGAAIGMESTMANCVFTRSSGMFGWTGSGSLTDNPEFGFYREDAYTVKLKGWNGNSTDCNFEVDGYVQFGEYAAGNLPSATVSGRRCFVTDATATTFYSIVAGGGANYVPVFSDGTNWRIG